MSFLETVAQFLDSEGTGYRIHEGVISIPMDMELELRVEPVDTGDISISAASIFLIDGEEETLIGVSFSPEDAVAQILQHVSIDSAALAIEELLEGLDPRTQDIDFEVDDTNSLKVVAQMAHHSQLIVSFQAEQGSATASVTFATEGEEVYEELTLGEFEDKEQIFNVIAVVAQRAKEWEQLLSPISTLSFEHKDIHEKTTSKEK